MLARVWASGFLAAITLSACSESPRVEGVAMASHVAREPLAHELPMEPWEAVPVPPADGPALIPMKMASPVYARPDKQAEKIGYLRIGARVARSDEPVSFQDCADGWYGVRPLGFVCAGDDATIRLDHPLARAFGVEPRRDQPMPYAYAFVRAIAPNYLRIPDRAEQFQYEMRLERHLRNWRRLTHEWDALSVGANDVPLNAAGLAVGPTPTQPAPLDMNARFGGGPDTVPWWLDGGRQVPNIAAFDVGDSAVMTNRVQRHAGVALIGSFVAGPEAQNRRFAITPDGRLLPADKLKADAGSPFHGSSLRDVGLPAAFAWRHTARYWHYEEREKRFKSGERLGRREFAALSGEVKVLGDERWVEARDGRWLRSKDLRVAVKPRTLPWFATGKRRWIDVSLMNQVMVLWEGEDPVYATLVSTGRDGLGDPETTMSTPQGVFRILQKHLTNTMDSNVADSEYELRDVPWVMYFKGGYALHAAYWHDDFGHMRSHGCVNLSPIDARFVFEWSAPDVPQHWHGSYAGKSFGEGTILRIGP